MSSAITIRLGQRARSRIAAEGMLASDIAIIPAAGGGPKGHAYGQNHTGRIRDWTRAFARWCEKPDLKATLSFQTIHIVSYLQQNVTDNMTGRKARRILRL